MASPWSRRASTRFSRGGRREALALQDREVERRWCGGRGWPAPRALCVESRGVGGRPDPWRTLVTRPHSTRWPAAVGLSVAAHLAVVGGLFVVLRHPPVAPSPPAPHPRAVGVMRIGVLPRALHSAPLIDAPPTPTRAGRVALAAPRPLTVDSPAPSQVVLAATTAPTVEESPTPSVGTEAPAATGGDPVGRETVGPDASPAARAGGAETGGSREAAVDLTFTRELHALLAAAASQCYPPQARRFRQQARVPVSFCIDTDGQPERIVVTPSGIASLDEAAGSCVVRRAAPFPQRARAHCFTVPIDFGVRAD